MHGWILLRYSQDVSSFFYLLVLVFFVCVRQPVVMTCMPAVHILCVFFDAAVRPQMMEDGEQGLDVAFARKEHRFINTRIQKNPYYSFSGG